MADSIATLINPVASATGTKPSTTSGATIKDKSDNATLAANFQSFLTLLTTQLKNQNPLEPLDTNQFTQQLVQFAGVEQQMKMNTQMASLITIEQTAQSTAAMAYLGSTATVDGATAKLADGSATWTFNSPKTSSASIAIKDASGATAYTGNFTVNAGQQNFQWDGKGNNGTQWPDGSYTMSIDGEGQPDRASRSPPRSPERSTASISAPARRHSRSADRVHGGQDQARRPPGA